MGERTVLLAQRRRRSIIGWTLAAVSFAERLETMVAPSPQLYLVGSISWFLFFAFVTGSELRSLLRHKEVTSETISMSISVYLLLGLTWGLLYVMIFAFTHRPSASDRLPHRSWHPKIRALPDFHLLQPDNPIDRRFWRHHAADVAIALRGGRRGYHRTILSGDSGGAVGGDADEPSGRKVGRAGTMIVDVGLNLEICQSRVESRESTEVKPASNASAGGQSTLNSRLSTLDSSRLSTVSSRLITLVLVAALFCQTPAAFAQAEAPEPSAEEPAAAKPGAAKLVQVQRPVVDPAAAFRSGRLHAGELRHRCADQ